MRQKSKKKLQKDKFKAPVFLRPANKKISRRLSREDPVEALNLPTRLERALKRGGYWTVGEFLLSSEEGLDKIKNVGPKSLDFFSQTKVKAINKIKSPTTTSTNPFSFDNYTFPSRLSAKDPIDALELPLRLENALKRSGYITVNCLIKCSEKELFKVRNIGIKSVNFLSKLKKEIDQEIDSASVTPIPVADREPEIPNNELIDCLLDRCKDERLMEIINRRYGLTSGEKETLEEIGKTFRVTRERIRQLQLQALRKMKHPSTKTKKPIIRIIEKTLWKKGGIISDEEADSLIPILFKNKKHNGSLLLNLIADLNWIQKYAIGDVVLYSPRTDMPALSEISNETIAVLKRHKVGKTPRSVVSEMRSHKEISNANFKATNFVKRYCLLDPRILVATDAFGYKPPADSFIFYSQYRWTNIWISRIKRILEREQAPLHFTEIANRVNDSLASQEHRLETRRAHAILIDNSKFAHTGIRGTYGLTKWGIRKESTPELVAECLKKAGFPLHWKQIYYYVGKYKDSRKESIIAILSNNRRFVKKRSGVFGLRDKRLKIRRRKK